MDNQHKKIRGYRDLTQAEINLMNEIKLKGQELEDLITKVNEVNQGCGAAKDSESFRWSAIAKTNLRTGLMALTRAVAKPTFF